MKKIIKRVCLESCRFMDKGERVIELQMGRLYETEEDLVDGDVVVLTKPYNCMVPPKVFGLADEREE